MSLVSLNYPVATDVVAYDDRDAAFEAMIATRRRALIGYAYSLVGNRTDAEDLAAEAVARCWAALRRRPIDQLDLYVRRTIVNLAIQRSRRRQIEERYKPCRRDDWRVAVDTEHPFELSMLDRDDLVAALRRLPADQRATLVTRFIFGHSEEETALILSIRVGTVKSRCSRAIAALRATMSPASLADA